MKKRKKATVKFSDKKHSLKGIISLIIGLISMMAFLVLAILSSNAGGNSGIAIGIAGMALFFVSLAGFILGIKACKEKEIYYSAPIAGLSINGFLVIIYFILYIIGVSLS